MPLNKLAFYGNKKENRKEDTMEYLVDNVQDIVQ